MARRTSMNQNQILENGLPFLCDTDKKTILFL